MAEDLTVPVAGKVNKRATLIAAGVAAAYVGWHWYQARSGAGTGTGGVAGADAQSSAGEGDGSVSSYSNPATYGGGSASFDSGSATSSAPQTDQQWTAAVVSDLGNIGYDPQTVAEALAAYLASQMLTQAQATIIRLAKAYEGPAPQHPNLPILVQPAGGTSSGSGSGSGGTSSGSGGSGGSGSGGTTKPPTKTPTPPSNPNVYPKRWKSVVNGPGATYSSLAVKYQLGISGEELYQYQLSKEAGRPASTVATLKKRGPGLIYPTGTTVLPYPKRK